MSYKGSTMATRRLFLLTMALILPITEPAHARRGQLIHNVVDPMPPTVSNLSLDRLETLIVNGGGSHGWTFRRISLGHLEATYTHKTHIATVDIIFDKEILRITYKASENLGHDGDLIHPHYNAWIQKLEQNINLKLNAYTK